jgi:hypothetical protein
MAMPSALAVPPLNMVRIGPLMFVIKPALPSQRLETFWGRLKKWTALSNSLGTSTKNKVYSKSESKNLIMTIPLQKIHPIMLPIGD